jgi:uroporphyrin-III C-methyltransferase
LLTEADIVLHDDLVPQAIVALAGARAEVVNVGKRCGAKKITQQEINGLMIDGARRGCSVLRLKSGDPGIFGRLAEEIDALEQAGIEHEVIPGVTAGVAAAASLGISLTDRRKSARVVIVTGHKPYADQAGAIDWKSLAREDATLVIYMPGHEFSQLRDDLLASGLAPETPAVIVSRASTPEQREQFTTVGNLTSVTHFEAPSVLLIGRSLEGTDEKTRLTKSSQALQSAALTLSSE